MNAAAYFMVAASRATVLRDELNAGFFEALTMLEIAWVDTLIGPLPSALFKVGTEMPAASATSV